MKRNGINRRDILRQFGIGAMTAAIAGNTFLAGCAAESIKQAATVNKPNRKRKLYEKVTRPSRVVVTLSLKNVLLGCPVSDGENNDKFLMHTGRIAVDTVLHYNMFHLAQQIYPDLSVIDGFEGMEGDGPIKGTPFDSRVALAGTDPLAADTLATKIMGFDPKRILYLSAMNEAGLGQGDIDKINILGTPLDQCLYHFKPNHLMAELYNL